ncbi:MAG: fumarylacetoacetate hydrolase family protein [Gammaproteobacteria bacterium]
MEISALQTAAELLWNAWRQGQTLPALPDHCRPQSLTDGYAIQAMLAELSDDAVAGWKIAATSAAGQKHINVDGPIAGRLFAGKILPHSATLALGANRMRVAEAEFAFRMGRDLPPRAHDYSQDEVMAAVASLHPAIEIPDSRFSDFTKVGGAQLVADDACAFLFVLGNAAGGDWRSANLADHPVELRINDATVTRGRGADALGDPRIALTWLANSHALRGEGLKAGQVITTGVCGAPSAIKPGDRVIADFGALGRVEARPSA